MRKSIFLFVFFLFPLVSGQADDLNNSREIIHSLGPSYEKINDYSAILIKQERIRGILHREETISFKFQKPFRLYMKWLPGPGEGREILYDPEKNEGKMLIKPHGLISLILPLINIEPDNPMVKAKSRHTIKEAGLGEAIKNLINQYDLAHDEGDLKIINSGEEVKGNRKCLKIESFFPEGKKYYAGHIVTYIDCEYNLPTHISIYDWKDNLQEAASYNELRLNPGFTESDFNPRHPAYGFKVK